MAISQKYRPAQFDEVLGQAHVITTLKNAIRMDRVASACLFSGPRGTGKTTTARLLARAVNCLSEGDLPCGECQACTADIHLITEVDAASNNGVADIKNVVSGRDKAASGFRHVYLIDEVHMLSRAAFAELDTVIKNDPRSLFVFATTEPQKVPAGILQKVHHFAFQLLSNEALAQRLTWICSQEGLQISEDVLNLLVQLGHGSVRDTERFLDQLATTPMALTNIRETQRIIGLASETAVMDFTDALSSRDNAAAYAAYLGVASEGLKPRLFAAQLVNYWRELWVLQSAGPGCAGQIITSAGYAPDLGRCVHHAGEIDRKYLKGAIDAFESLAASDTMDPNSAFETLCFQL